VFGAVFTKLGSATLITNSLLAVPMGDWWKLALIMAIFFVLGWPFEWPVILFVFLPIVLPVIDNPIMYIVAILAGTVVTAVSINLLKSVAHKREPQLAEAAA